MELHIGTAGWQVTAAQRYAFPTEGTHLHRYAARLGAAEINSSFYRPHATATYARWRAQTPPGFRFAVKLPRAITHQARLREAGEALHTFLDQVAGLSDRLGCLLVQLPPSLRFDAVVADGFLRALRRRHAGDVALEPRHASFACADYVRLARSYGVATVYTDSPDYPNIADPTADFVYARLMRSQPGEATGYPPRALDQWAARVRRWQQGALPAGLPLVDPATAPAHTAPREVFVQFIAAAKARNPAAATGLIERLASA